MTRVEVYTSALDRQIVINETWSNPKCQYIRIGEKFIMDKGQYITVINMLNESAVDTWKLKGQISKVDKLKLQIRLMLQIYRETK